MNDLKIQVMTTGLENYNELHSKMYEVQKAKIAYKEAIKRLDEFISSAISNENTEKLNVLNQIKEYSNAYSRDVKYYTDQIDYKWQALMTNLSGELIKSI